MAARTERFAERYGPWAIVAGASEGLGFAFAEALAARGLNLLLVARRPDVLGNAAENLTARYAVEVQPVALDLSDPTAAEAVQAASKNREVGLIVYNAAYSLIGPFLDHSLDEHRKELAVNCHGPLAFAHNFGAQLKRRGSGGLVLVSSLAGFNGSAMLVNYAATKAYNLVLAEGLWDEFQRYGVDVLAVCAGATRTPSYERNTPTERESRFVPVQCPEDVAREALAALGRRPVLIPGRANRLAAGFMRRLLTRRRAVRLMSRNTRRLYGNSENQ